MTERLGSSVGRDKTKGIFSSGESNGERVHGMSRWRWMIYIPSPVIPRLLFESDTPRHEMSLPHYSAGLAIGLLHRRSLGGLPMAEW